MRTILIGALALLMLATISPFGGANHAPGAECPTYVTAGLGGVGVASTTVGVNPSLQLYVSAVHGNYYIVNDAVGTGNWVSSLWIYQEANGVGGLQRHDDFCFTKDFNSDALRDKIVF